MKIQIKHCNNIEEATISIELNRLNIKYGINGTGKSTIAKAVELSLAKKGLNELMPFKYRNKKDSSVQPSIAGAESLKSVSIFNETYINQFLFKQDEILQNSFDIFIKTADYDKKMKEIEELFFGIKDIFTKDEELSSVISDLNSLSESFGKSQTGYHKGGKLAKGIGGGNKIEHIPEGLRGYANFIKSENSVKWIGWQTQGNNFLEISSECPYCTSSTKDKKEVILSVSKEYDPKTIEHLNSLIHVLERLGKYFSPDTFNNLDKLFKNKAGLKEEEIKYLVAVKEQVEILKNKLTALREISFFSLKDVDKIAEMLVTLQINIDYLQHLKSDVTLQKVMNLNKSIDALLAKVGRLQGEVATHKSLIQETIKKYNLEINNFLQYAGYKYNVDIPNDGKTYKMKLKHLEFTENIEDAKSHLSYGERNAFALVLFMYENLARNPDLIILDDPISSFDKNKKFAIIDMLFRGKESLQGKTVLLFTHDIEPVIDTIKIVPSLFTPVPVADFLTSKAGIIKEVKITSADLISFSQVCSENIQRNSEDILKLIYLRRYYEINDDKGLEYQMLSSLLKKKAVPEFKDGQSFRKMTDEDCNQATAGIKRHLATFDYSTLAKRISDKTSMLDLYKGKINNYEKLQLFRVLNIENHDNVVIRKFVNETYHIENEYITQLNPNKYDFVPDFIAEECNKTLES